MSPDARNVKELLKKAVTSDVKWFRHGKKYIFRKAVGEAPGQHLSITVTPLLDFHAQVDIKLRFTSLSEVIEVEPELMMAIKGASLEETYNRVLDEASWILREG